MGRHARVWWHVAGGSGWKGEWRVARLFWQHRRQQHLRQHGCCCRPVSIASLRPAFSPELMLLLLLLLCRRDIGKNETWGSKDDSGAGARLITCLTCGTRWTIDGGA